MCWVIGVGRGGGGVGGGGQQGPAHNNFVGGRIAFGTYILKHLNMKKNIDTLSMHGEKFYQIHTETTTAVATSK